MPHSVGKKDLGYAPPPNFFLYGGITNLGPALFVVPKNLEVEKFVWGKKIASHFFKGRGNNFRLQKLVRAPPYAVATLIRLLSPPLLSLSPCVYFSPRRTRVLNFCMLNYIDPKR